MRGRADVAEDRAVAARQNGRQPPPLPRERRATHRVDTAMHPPQATQTSTALNRVLTEPQRPQLRERHHPPLPPGQRREPSVGGCAL